MSWNPWSVRYGRNPRSTRNSTCQPSGAAPAVGDIVEAAGFDVETGSHGPAGISILVSAIECRVSPMTARPGVTRFRQADTYVSHGGCRRRDRRRLGLG